MFLTQDAASPRVGCSNPGNIRMVVVLPEPFRPRNANTHRAHLQVQVINGRPWRQIPRQTLGSNNRFLIIASVASFTCFTGKLFLERLSQFLMSESIVIASPMAASISGSSRRQPSSRVNTFRLRVIKPAAGPGFDQPVPHQIGVGAGNGIRVHNQILGQGANGGELIPTAICR